MAGEAGFEPGCGILVDKMFFDSFIQKAKNLGESFGLRMTAHAFDRPVKFAFGEFVLAGPFFIVTEFFDGLFENRHIF